MTQLNPAQFRLLLAGPRVSRLLPFFTARGYVADGAASGQETVEHLRAAPRHVLLVELELGDMLLADLLRVVHGENLAGAVILLEDPMKSGLIVSTLLRGVDAYVSTPPDEAYLFRIIERQLLAQWALAQAGQQEASAQELVRLEKQMALERGKVTELVREIASLREELASARAAAAVAPRQSGGGKVIPGFDDDDGPTAQQLPVHVNPPPMPLVRGKPTGPSLSDLDDLDPPTMKPAVTPAQRLTPPSMNTEPMRLHAKPAVPAPTAEELNFARGTLNDLDLDDDSGAFEEPTIERTAQNAAANLGNIGRPGAGLGFDDDDDEQKTRTAAMVNPAALKTVGKPPAKPASAPARPVKHVQDDSTSPAGWTAPAELRGTAGPGNKDVGFGAVSRTVPSDALSRPSVASALDEEVVFDDASSSDLLLDLDDATAALSQPMGTAATKSAGKPDDFLLDLDDLKDD